VGKLIIRMGLISALFLPAYFLAAGSTVDFDKANNEYKNGMGDVIDKTLQNNSAELADLEIRKTITSSENGAGGIPAMRLFKTNESGKEEIVAPFATSGDKATYEFMPNADRWREFSCTGQNPQPWGVCWSVDFRPATAGHNHPPAGKLSWIDPASPANNPQLLPAKMCKYNIPGNTSSRIYFKAPVYSTHVLEEAEFYGWCQGAIRDEVFVRVTARNLIQLNELGPEPYFVLKEADENHAANRFATPDTIAKLKQIAWEYYSVYKPTATEKMITVNDAGLIWGGRYNTFYPYNCWIDGNEHFYHRYGRQVDIRSWNIPYANRACFEEICCKYQVHPILEGKAPGSVPERDYSNLSFFEADILDRVEHYHLNFARPTDMVVVPKDDARASCASFIPPEVSACPKLPKYKPLP